MGVIPLSVGVEEDGGGDEAAEWGGEDAPLALSVQACAPTRWPCAPGPALGTGNAAAITVDNHPAWDFISTLSTRKLSLRGPSVLLGQAWQTAGTGGGQDCPSSICHEAPAPASGLPCTIAPSARTSHCSGAELSLLGDYLLAPRFLPGGQLCRTRGEARAAQNSRGRWTPPLPGRSLLTHFRGQGAHCL